MRGSISELQLTLGNIPEAVAAARQCVGFSDRGGDRFRRMASRTTLGAAFHQSGYFAEAARLFGEAERLQAESQPEYPVLYSLQGYRYCDFLLGQGKTAEVLTRASQTLLIAERNLWLLAIGLDHISLGLAHPPGTAEATHHLDRAVDFLRRAGAVEFLTVALLARSSPRDLDEVFRAATRYGMRLYLADYHLAMARRAHARDHLEKAERLIGETGYHRRDRELAELRAWVHA